MGPLEMPAYPSPTDEEEKEDDDDDDFRAAANPVLAPPAVARGNRGSGVLPSASRTATLGDDGKYLHDGRSAVPAARAAAVAARLRNVSDYTLLASHVWVDGVRDGRTGRYLPNRTPFLTKRVHRSCVLHTPPPRLSLPLTPASLFLAQENLGNECVGGPHRGAGGGRASGGRVGGTGEGRLGDAVPADPRGARGRGGGGGTSRRCGWGCGR